MADETEHTLDRREFGRRVAGVGMAGMAGLSAASQARGISKSPFPPGEYVDFQTHLGQKWASRPALSAGALIQWMDAHDVSQAVVQPLVNPEARIVPITTHYVLRETKPYRDRLIPFCVVDPRHPGLEGVESKIEILQRYVDAGAMGFGEHKIGLPIDDPRSIEMYQACGELDLPIMFHMDSHRNLDEPGLPGLENALQQAPNATFVGHAHGFWASISADARKEDFQSYPERPVEPGGALDRLFGEYPNLYGDVSAGSGASAFQRDMEFGRKFIIRWADRLLFSSDYLRPGQTVPQFEIFDKMDLPDDVERKFYRENSRKLLGLSRG